MMAPRRSLCLFGDFLISSIKPKGGKERAYVERLEMMALFAFGIGIFLVSDAWGGEVKGRIVYYFIVSLAKTFKLKTRDFKLLSDLASGTGIFFYFRKEFPDLSKKEGGCAFRVGGIL